VPNEEVEEVLALGGARDEEWPRWLVLLLSIAAGVLAGGTLALLLALWILRRP
jgi:hypothetical protein